MIRDEDSIKMLAQCVEDCVYQSLLNAQADPSREAYWFSHADKLESKFKTEFGKHYTAYTHPEWKITYT